MGVSCVYLSTLYAFEQDKRKLDCVPDNGREWEQLTLYLPLILHPTWKNLHNASAFLEFVVLVAWTQCRSCTTSIVQNRLCILLIVGPSVGVAFKRRG